MNSCIFREAALGIDFTPTTSNVTDWDTPRKKELAKRNLPLSETY